MPFTDCKLSRKLDGEQKDKIKRRLGEAVRVLGKPESYLMVGIADGYDLYFGSKKLENGAYVSVSLFGSATSAAYEKMTGIICDILGEELGAAGSEVYVTYHGVNDWGWNGANF